ncbi:MAG: MoCo/4Fe-4S cofactor protein with predicted Tat translocation signal [Chitinophagales bacterium]|jgi:MoCo/4Fe-4S cofactor protein with predicted Tat translocation signal
MANKKQYWLSLDEKNNEMEANSKEFGTDLPVLNSLSDTISTQKSGRRDFLKMLGFGVSAAAVAAACEVPVRKSIPYLVKPEEITPGIPNYYASAYTQGGNYNSFLVKTREGRPILVEGNPDSSITNGGVNPKAIGSLLSLYDEAGRLRGPMKGGQTSDWDTVSKEIGLKLAELAASGKKIALLSSTIISPSTKKVIEKFASAFTTAEWVQFDAISCNGILDANMESFGKRALPEYHFDKAELIVGIAADFLGTWVSPTEYAADYAKGRKVSEVKKTMSRHIQIESIPTLSGTNADLRIPVKPSQEDLSVIKLYNAIAKKMGASTVSDEADFLASKIEALAAELTAAKGKSIVVSGSNKKSTQLLVNAINDMLGNYGSTVTWDRACYYRQGDDTKLQGLLTDMSAGSVGAVLVMDANPAYVFGESFTSALEKVELTVDFSERKTETSGHVEYALPNHHYLESWNDAMPKDGVYATIQPTISHLFNTKSTQELLLSWSGDNSSYYDFIQANWKETVLGSQSKFSGFEALWNNAVHDGELTFEAKESASFAGVDASAAASDVLSAVSASGLEVKLYEKVQIGDGSLSDNPWMQELPDPITRMTWDGYFVASPKWIENQDLTHNAKNREYRVVSANINGVEFTLPVVGLPGVPEGVLGLAYGYGRSNTTHPEYSRGENAFKLIDRSTIKVQAFAASDVVEQGGHKMGIVQQEYGITHTGLGGDKTRKVVKETTLTDWQANHASDNDINFGSEWMDRKEWIEKYSYSLYGEETNEDTDSKDYGGAHVAALGQGHHWGMGVDLNSCIGCGACVVACNVENNVPIVGRNEVRRAHDMNWLRIDKYHSGDEDNPQVIFQPMMCQHCDNAPCENVCPVAATNHSSEGLNQMTYNRCIGTRYCANNCPYKVRRFNWFDYQGADSFSSNEGFILDNDFDAVQTEYGLGDKEAGIGLHSPMAKLVLNPDVTVRSRGVIEKCSFCVQRIQLGKLDAKKSNRGLKDSDIVTACQSACPTSAITFGDTNNRKSAVSQVWADPRAFGVIEEIHTLPSVRYLTKVRNQNEGDLA